MPLAAARALITAAAVEHRTLAAFDAITLEHVQAVVEGAESVGAPVIIQVSESVVQYDDGRLLPLARAAAEAARSAAVPVALHLDKVRRTALLAQAAHCGFSSIMYDAARLPYGRNVAVTRDAAQWAHEQNLWIEAEAVPATAGVAACDPGAARTFAAATGVDALTVPLGAHPDRGLLARLRAALDLPLVLRDTPGGSDHDLGDLGLAAAEGIAKVTVGAGLDRAMTAAVRASLALDDSTDPRVYLREGRRAMTAAVARIVRALNTPTAPGTSADAPVNTPLPARA
ncbi:class II fructose-bisphosphate aldolase [Actinacidiphila alni]|uniref:class II fructose-bisphosphate aldolase n=1 Tax=Actinacidiphila alni TaxID=380248 RepID=UPI0033BFC9D4